MGPAATVTLLIGVVLAPLNTTMISVALVPIAADLGVEPAAVMWLVVSLYLSGGVAQPLAGVLVDRAGARVVFIGGLIIVAVAGLLPLIVSDFLVVVFARILLGFGLAGAYPSALAYVRHQANRVGQDVAPATLAAISTASLVTAVIGPLVGGLLVTFLGWAATFWVNTLLAAFGVVLASLFLHGDKVATSDSQGNGWTLDVVGLGLFTVSMTSLTAVLLSADVPTAGFLVISAVTAVVFVVWEYRARHPFIDVRLLARNGPLARTYLRLLLTYLGPYTITYAMSQWLQYRGGMSALEAGASLLPMAVTASIATIVVSRSQRVFGSLIVAAASSVVGGLALAVTTSVSPVWAIIACIALFGVTHGLCAVSNQLALYRFAPAEALGIAAGLSRSAVSMSALVTASVIALAFPSVPTDDGLNILGLIVAGCAGFVLVLVLIDRSLRR